MNLNVKNRLKFFNSGGGRQGMMIISWILFVISMLSAVVELVETLKEDELYERVTSFLGLIIWCLVLAQSYMTIW